MSQNKIMHMASLGLKRSLSIIVLPLLSFSALTFLSACTKQREAHFPHNVGQDLYAINEYEGKVFDLQTEDLIGEWNASQASELKTKADKKAMNSYGLVHYKTDAKLMKDVPFRGRSKTNYKVRYSIEQNYVKVYKIGKIQDMSVDEQPTLSQTVDGMNETPVVGYPIIGFYKVEKRKNDLGEDTSELTEVPQKDKSTATHFKVDWNGRRLFRPVARQDVFPKKYFEGDWYYNATIASTGKISASALGFQLNNSDIGKIQFKISEKEMLALDQNADERVQKGLKDGRSTSEDFDVVLRIPIEQVDYRIAKEGSANALEEEIAQDLPLAKRRFVKTDLARLSPKFLGGDKVELADLEFTDDYFGFTLYDSEIQTRIYYSFYRSEAFRSASGTYQPRVYPKEDRTVFGFFEAEKNITRDWSNQSREIREKSVFVSRFNPNREIVFRLTANTPDWVKPVVRKSIEAWNKAFQVAAQGTGSSTVPKVVLDEKEPARLGDLRFNVINMIEKSYSLDSWLGLGPKVADPTTGEIVSATANVDVGHLVSSLSGKVKDYLRYKAGQLNKAQVVTLTVSNDGLLDSNEADAEASTAAAGKDGSSSTTSLLMNPSSAQSLVSLEDKSEEAVLKNAKEGKLLSGKILSIVDSRPGSSKDSLVKYKSFESRFNQLLRDRKNQKVDAQGKRTVQDPFRKMNQQIGLESYVMLNGDLIKRIETTSECSEVVNLGKSISAEKLKNIAAEPIEKCARGISTESLYGTLLHELGHNFGLRHNFAGSSDWFNFLGRVEKDLSKVNYFSSSVMDYLDFKDEKHPEIGLYDIAALRYGYFDSVELSDGKIRRFDIQNAISGTQGLKQQMRPFRYCTDIDAYYTKLDPMCALHDFGYTPLMAVKQLIESYNMFVNQMTYRGDRDHVYPGYIATQYRMELFMLPLKRFYEEWRYRLAYALPKSDWYLERFFHNINEGTNKDTGPQRNSDLNYSVVINDLLKSNPDFKKVYDEYFQAARLAHDFLLKIATATPDLSCVVVIPVPGEASQIRLEPLQPFQLRAREMGNEVPETCEAALPLIKAKNRFYSEATLLEGRSSIGIPNYDFHYGASSDDRYAFPDVSGFAGDKAVAYAIMATRYPESLRGLSMDFYPNMFDEPDLKIENEAALMSRMMNGQSLSQLSLPESLTPNSVNFETEAPILRSQFVNMYLAQFIPGKTELNERRRLNFRLSLNISEKSLTPETQQIKILGSNYFATADRAYVNALVKALKAKLLVKHNRRMGDFINTIGKIQKSAMKANESVSLESFIAFMNQIQEATASDASSSPNMKDVVLVYLKKEIEILGRAKSVIDQLQSLGSSISTDRGYEFIKRYEKMAKGHGKALSSFIEKSNGQSQRLLESIYKMPMADFIETFASDIKDTRLGANGDIIPTPLRWDLNYDIRQESFNSNVLLPMYTLGRIGYETIPEDVDAQVDLLNWSIGLDAGF